MKFTLKLIRFYLNTLSFFIPKYAGKVAVDIFQKVRLKDTKYKEKEFYSKSNAYKIKYSKGNLDIYELGNPKGNIVFLVHGWDSNAGSLGKFAFKLAESNKYRVIAFDLPAHNKSEEKFTNLYICKNAFKTLLDHIRPTESFNIISHSFGCVVTAFALSETNYKINKIVFLSSIDIVEDVFKRFQKLIGFNKKVYDNVRVLTHKIIGEPLENLIVSDRLLKCSFDKLLLIHDRYDKVVPFKNSESIHSKISNSFLLTFNKIGHYRMLWKNDVVNETIYFLENQ